MDKKELNDLIDRVVLTGPGGVDRIKKILKEIANGSESGGSDSGCQCLAPMFVSGTTNDDNYFTPGEGTPSWGEAQEQMFNGGLVYMVVTYDGEPVAVALATMASDGTISAPILEACIIWERPSD